MMVRRTLEGAPKWTLRDLRLDEARPMIVDSVSSCPISIYSQTR